MVSSFSSNNVDLLTSHLHKLPLVISYDALYVGLEFVHGGVFEEKYALWILEEQEFF